ncbi:MAG: murein biosynthesis integral membrane protein MurJ [Verrucomicrobia bacterium]|nr:murein biosynthesis integral membrane protein MurJ [Verrucomicrobiota bacterium]
MAVHDRHSATKAAGVVSLAVMLSRVLGLLRDLLFAALFGAGRSMDAFIIAFRAPNLLRDLFAEGALSTAFVTVFSRKIAKEGDASAWRLAAKMATLTTVFMSLISILGVIFADPLIGLLAPGFDPAKRHLTVVLAQVMYPFILLISLAALVMGMLNAKNRFAVPALASSFFNMGSIVGGIGIGYILDPTFGNRALVGLAMGTLIGGLLQLAVQLPSLKSVGFHFYPDFKWRDPGVVEVLTLMAPAVISGSAVQVNVMINGIFASHLGDGPVSWLSNAFRLIQLPIGVFGVAISTVTLPVISKSAALRDSASFRSTLARALRLAFFLTIPSTIGLVVLARPIIELLFQRGRFSSHDTFETASVLQFYAIGLAAYSGIKVLAPAFYAIDKKYTPMIVSFVSIGSNLLLNWLFTFSLGFGQRGLALSTGLVAVTNFLIYYVMMQSHARTLESNRLVWTLFRIFVAGLFMGVICLAGDRYLISIAHGKIQQAFALALVLAVSMLDYALMTFLLRMEEMQDILAIVQRRFMKRPLRA